MPQPIGYPPTAAERLRPMVGRHNPAQSIRRRKNVSIKEAPGTGPRAWEFFHFSDSRTVPFAVTGF